MAPSKKKTPSMPDAAAAAQAKKVRDREKMERVGITYSICERGLADGV